MRNETREKACWSRAIKKTGGESVRGGEREEEVKHDLPKESRVGKKVPNAQ